MVLFPFWALSAWSLYRALVTSAVRHWALTGVWLALGMLTKYDMAVLICARIAPHGQRPCSRRTVHRGALCDAGGRARVVRSPSGLGGEQSIPQHSLHAIPHRPRSRLGGTHRPSDRVSRLAGTHALGASGRRVAATAKTTTSAGSRTRTRQVAFCRPHQWSNVAKRRSRFSADRLLRADGVAISAVSVATGVKIQSPWGAPIWVFIGLFVMWIAGQVADVSIYRRLAAQCAIAGCVLVICFAVRNVAFPYWRHRASRIHFPGVQLAALLEDEWQKETNQPLSVVAGPWWPVGNVGLNLPDRVDMYDFFNPQLSPWAGDEELRRRGGIVVWEDEIDGVIRTQEVRRRFPNARILQPVAVAWQTGGRIPPGLFRRRDRAAYRIGYERALKARTAPIVKSRVKWRFSDERAGRSRACATAASAVR